jgi:hypothetical protein
MGYRYPGFGHQVLQFAGSESNALDPVMNEKDLAVPLHFAQ